MPEKRNRRQTGTDYEQAVGFYLEQMGWEILEYNYRCRSAEIDIVAREGEYLVFCEVKYRSDGRKGDPLEAVDVRKQQRLRRAALFYLTEHGKNDIPCRFDVIGIQGTKITHIHDAF